MKIKFRLEMAMLLVALIAAGVSSVGAFPTETHACNSPGCHAYPPKLLNISTNITNITVSPGQNFTVGITWSGGANDNSTLTAVKWPTDFTLLGIIRDNSLFNITPILPVVGTNASGTTSSTLTAPTTPGNYTVRVHVSTGNWIEIPTHETNFSDINVTVTAPTVVPALTTIMVSPSTATLNVNGTQVFNATALDQNNTPMAGVNITWTVSNSTVGNISSVNATTDTNGTASTMFTALATGTTMVNATSGNVSGSANVTVTAPTPVPTPTAPKLTLTLNNTMDGTAAPLVSNITSAVLLNTSGTQVETATLPDNMTAQFNLSSISPGDYFIEVNGLAGDHLPTRIDSNASDINQTVGLRLRNSVIGDISNPTYRIKVYASGTPPVVNSSHPVVNYATGLNESIYNFVIVPGNTSRIEVRALNTSEELSNFTPTSDTHPAGANFSSEPFQIWILGDVINSTTGAFIGNHGHLYNNTDSNCNTCHGNLSTKASAFSDITPSNGWCFRCHYGKTGPRNGFVDPRVVVAANGTIAGNVTNASNGSAIPGATVTANGMMATTDANGSYNISIAAGTYTVTANATGYQTNTTTGVVVTAGNVTTQDFALTPTTAPIVTGPQLMLTLNASSSGSKASNFTSAVLLDKTGAIVESASSISADGLTTTFNLTGIVPDFYFIEVNGLSGDRVPTFIDNNATNISQVVTKGLTTTTVGDATNPAKYRIKARSGGMHPIVNYFTGKNETGLPFVIVYNDTSPGKIEVREVNTSRLLTNFTPSSLSDNIHTSLQAGTTFQSWQLNLGASLPGFTGLLNHGQIYNNTDSKCTGCHGINMNTKPDNYTDVGTNFTSGANSGGSGWCFKCHYGGTNGGDSNGFVDPTMIVAANGTIAGNVTNASSSLPISGATVTADGMTATTDTNGSYSMRIAAGTYNVTASATGFQSNTTTGVVVTAGNVTTQDFALIPTAAPITVPTFQVLAGGETPDMAMQGLGFYPGNITINEGDTINWTLGGHLVHTISFLSGAPVPDPGSPEVLLPAGGSTYNGTGVVSSGLLLPGMNYSVTFTKQGFYAYQCLIHPGMAGVVIVQPKGSPYPANQAQYTAQGMNELQTDIDTGQKLANNLSLETTPGTNGTTVFHTSADIPLPTNASLLLLPKNNSNVTGNATLNFIDVGKLQVQVMVSGLVPNSTHPAHIHVGTSAEGGPILYPLNNITADMNGIGTSTTVITGPPWFAISSRGWFINVHQGPTMEGIGATPISSGDIVKHDASFVRFTPKNLTIHANDQVKWTNLNPMEIHTVTFPEAGTEPPELLLPNLTVNPVAATPAGGSVHNGTGFYNSGILNPGDNYTLTFTKPGTYDYVCVVHDNMNMVGEIVVLPPGGGTISGFKINGTNNNGMGIENWNIMLLNSTTGTPITSTMTDSTGFYNFTNLTNGTYNVTEGMMTGWTNASTSPMSQIVTINGSDMPNVNFTNMLISPTPAATFNISGFKINDTNGNGVWDSGEMGIENWNINLLNATGVLIDRQSTDATGFYQFMDVAPGVYNVTEEMRPGFTPTNATSMPITVENMDVMDVNFTNQITVTPSPQATFNVSGFKINGTNNNGMGIANWNIMLLNDTGAQIASTMTDNTGFYNFAGLTNGTYSVTEGMMAGWTNVSPMSQMVVINGADVPDVNFTNMLLPPAPVATFNISGFKVNDTNGNGVWDPGETGIAGWNIMLLNDTGAQIASTLTNAQGFYQFMDISPGNYNVAEEMKTGFTPTNDTSMPVTIGNMDVTNVNFTNQIAVTPPPQATFSISGFKVNDTDGDGMWKPGEMGIEGWNIMLLDDKGTQIASTSTNSQGFYEFTNLAPGTYNVTEEMREGFTPTSATSQVVTIKDMNVTDVNFLNMVTVTPPPQKTFNISGFKVNDTDGNGMWDQGEMGIEGWNIMLLDDKGTQIASTSTNSQGFYEFMNLAPGTYKVTEEMKEGFTPSSDISKEVTIKDMDITDVNFLNHVTVTPPPVTNTISGFKINDLNGNGKQDPRENGLPGWKIKLTGIVGTGTETKSINLETTTNADGFYMFDNLPAGSYIVTEELQGGFVPVGSIVKNIILADGENSENNNFFNQPVESIIPDTSNG